MWIAYGAFKTQLCRQESHLPGLARITSGRSTGAAQRPAEMDELLRSALCLIPIGGRGRRKGRWHQRKTNPVLLKYVGGVGVGVSAGVGW